MKNSEKALLMGARESKLSKVQSLQAINKLKNLIPALNFKPTWFSSPGDRDRNIDLRETPPDFFTEDLDNAILNDKIDCAIHSAKDLPESLKDGLDYFYLPWKEDPRDVIIYPKGKNITTSSPKIGISSERRELYAKKRFSSGKLLTIRGDIDSRIDQLDRGDYDIIIMAAAGMIRLGIADRISEYIPLNELNTPYNQGELAIVFKKNNPIFNTLRKLFVSRVIFGGAGIGTKANTTLGVINALKRCDICLYDALAPQELLDYLPLTSEKIYVGKREASHSLTQVEISKMIIDYARKGRKVVRLKGGDPGMFGRLAEEVDALNELELPYKVLPGVSALNVATTASGLLLTRRDISRGFTVSTPRKSGSSKMVWFSDEEKKSFPQLFFMGISQLKTILENLLNENYPSTTKISIIYNAGYNDQAIISGNISNIISKQSKISAPGIIIVGEVADSKYLFKNHGVLSGKRVLFTGSEALQEKASNIIEEFGGIPIIMPMIKLKLIDKIENRIDEILKADYLIVNSPSSATFFFEALKSISCDLRRLPKIAVCGKETEKIFLKHNIFPDICPTENYSAEALVKSLKGKIKSSDKIARLSSDKSRNKLTEELLKLSDNVMNITLYTNVSIDYDSLPIFDAVLFTSPSTVNAFVENFGVSSLKDKKISVIGKPTAKALKKICNNEFILSKEATIHDMIYSLAADYNNSKIKTFVHFS